MSTTLVQVFTLTIDLLETGLSEPGSLR
jgi:hypothetical protein